VTGGSSPRGEAPLLNASMSHDTGRDFKIYQLNHDSINKIGLNKQYQPCSHLLTIKWFFGLLAFSLPMELARGLRNRNPGASKLSKSSKDHTQRRPHQPLTWMDFFGCLLPTTASFELWLPYRMKPSKSNCTSEI